MLFKVLPSSLPPKKNLHHFGVIPTTFSRQLIVEFFDFFVVHFSAFHLQLLIGAAAIKVDNTESFESIFGR